MEEVYGGAVRMEAHVHRRFLVHCKQRGLIAAGIVSRLVAEYLRNPSRFTSVVQHSTERKSKSNGKSKK